MHCGMIRITSVVAFGLSATALLAQQMTVDSQGASNLVGFLQGFEGAEGRQAVAAVWTAQMTGGQGLTGFSASGFAADAPPNAPALDAGEAAPAYWAADHAASALAHGINDDVSAWLDSVTDHAGNAASIVQSGDGNRAFGLQAGSGLAAWVTQSGDDNSLSTAQATHGGVLTLSQDGVGNAGYVAQVGDLAAVSTVTQSGDLNKAALTQFLGASDAAGGMSHAAIAQTGGGNLASILAEGTTTDAGLGITQTGDGGIALLAAYGDDNSVAVTQASLGWANLYIDGSLNEVTVTQTAAADAVVSLVGNLNLLEMTQGGAGGFGSVAVLGNGNDMTVVMAGTGGYAALDITGNGNVVGVVQTLAAGNAHAAIRIGGNTNTVDLTQSAADTSAEVTIVNVSNRNDVMISQAVAGARATVTIDGNRNTYALAQHSVASVVVADIDGNRSYTIEQF